jgi:hypothetical protein
MRFRVLLTVLLAGGVGRGALPGGEPSRRAEEVEQTLARLAERCRKMLDLQAAVSEGTRGLHRAIQSAPDRKPRPEDRRGWLKLAADEKDIAREATRALEGLEAEGSAIAFTEVLQEVRKDMERLRLRLEGGDVGPDTQALAQEIVETLKEILSSFRKH